MAKITVEDTDEVPICPYCCAKESHDTISAAIAGAANELHDVERQFVQIQAQLQKLQYRASQLQSFIGLGHILLGKASSIERGGALEETELNHCPSSLQGILSQKLSAADYAKQVLEEVKRPMRAMEIADYLHQRGLMRGKWTREVLRTAMRKNQHIFDRITEGVYALKAWSHEQ